MLLENMLHNWVLTRLLGLETLDIQEEEEEEKKNWS